MSLLDILTGGKSGEASSDEAAALAAIQGVQTPTEGQLTLPELQQYVNAGVMTPAQATAALQNSNAYNNIQTDPSTTEAEMTALNQMQNVAGDNGMTPEMQAQLTGALDQANTNTQGERASIQDSLAQRGVSGSLMGAASQQAAAGQDAQTANLSATQAAGTAEQNALTAMANSGQLAGNINAQEYGQAANKAAAQNAINQWNAQNTTQNNQFNAQNQQASNLYNTQNAQTIGNANTENANARTQYNAQIPQTVYNDAMQKAGAEVGVRQGQAGVATGQGEQNAGIMGALTGLGVTSVFGGNRVGTGGNGGDSTSAGGGGSIGQEFSSLGSGSAGTSAATADASAMARGGLVMKNGGSVPGQAQVFGDSPRNDTVPARLSPGEMVIPRSKAQDPQLAKQFVQHLIRQKQPVKPVHPHDIRSMLDALSSRREAA